MRSFLLTCLTLLACALAAHAHPNLQDAMWVQFEPARVRVAVNVSLREISVAQGMAVNDINNIDSAVLELAVKHHGNYILKHLALSVQDSALTGQLTKVTPPVQISEPEQTFYQYELEYRLDGSTPLEVTFSQDMLREWPYAMGTAWDVSYAVRTKRSDSSDVNSWLLPYRQPVTIPTGWQRASTPALDDTNSNSWRTFREYLWHGVMHILTGYDHLLFIAALVIATVSFWEMVKVIAAFTLAHTITLTLCVFGIFRLPAFIVEPVIALSIVFVALENVLRPQRAHSRLRLAVAFGFGLIHGLGFAGGLLDAMAGLPSIGIWIALIAFSLGVEIGHQVVVLPLFGMLALSRHKLRDGFHPSLLRYSSMVISSCGAYYLFVALHEQFFSR